MSKKQLILVVESTAAMGPYFKSLLSDYLEDIIRNFCNIEVPEQKPEPTATEFALVTFKAHGLNNDFLVQRSGWTRHLLTLFDWLHALRFSGGGSNEAAIAEGLADALMMVHLPTANESQQSPDVQRHCILVAASNPYPLRTPVYRPIKPNSEQGENTETRPFGHLADALEVAKCFSFCPVTLSVISPKQIPKLKEIYNAGKGNARGTDPPLYNVKSCHHLVLLSENFIEARAALRKYGTTNLVANLNPVMTPAPLVSGQQPTSSPPVNGCIMNNRQAVVVPNIPQVTVEAEPTTIGNGPLVSVSQEMTSIIENIQEQKPNIAQQHTLGPGAANVNILNNHSQAQQVISSAAMTGGTYIDLQSMGQTHMAMHMTTVIHSWMVPSVPAPQTVISFGQSGLTSIGGAGLTGTAQVALQNPLNSAMSQSLGSSMNQGNLAGPQMVQSGRGIYQNMMTAFSGTSQPGMSEQVQPGMQSMWVNTNSAANMAFPQQERAGSQSAQPKYVKVWEGNLSVKKQGQFVFITRLEGYRKGSASETLAADWPPMMQIVRLISQDHINNKRYIDKAEFLVFRALYKHGFLGKLQERKLCSVIQLPSQTLLLSVSDNPCRFIGMLFPGDMNVYKPITRSQQK